MSDLVTYTAVLPVGQSAVAFVSKLLAAERARRRTRHGRRALSCSRQAVMVLRWLLDATRLSQLAVDNQVSSSTAYRYLHEAIDVLAARAAGHTHVHLDGTLIHTDRSRAPGPTAGMDLWWSGKHHHHGGNVQVVTAPDGWPLWTSPVRPGREHDTTCARAHDRLLDTLLAWTDDTHAVLADPGRREHPTDLPGQERRWRRADPRPAHHQRAACRHSRLGRTRQRPAQDHLHRATPGQPVSMADRCDHRRRVGAPTPPARPHNMINPVPKAATGKGSVARSCGEDAARPSAADGSQ